jgi:CheY-like chemotaxis protein
MKTKVLFIEDNKTKIEDVKSYISEKYKDINLTIKESFTSGLRELFTNDYDFIFLDMSLPTREGVTNNSLNNFEQLGGHKILNEMKRKNKIIPTILITMFSEFGVGQSFMDLNEVDEMCKKQFNEFYKGVVFYTLREDSWKEKLNGYLDELL